MFAGLFCCDLRPWRPLENGKHICTTCIEILTNKVCVCKDDENPGGNLGLKRFQVSLLALIFNIFQTFFHYFDFVQIFYYGNDWKLSDHFTNWATKTLVILYCCQAQLQLQLQLQLELRLALIPIFPASQPPTHPKKYLKPI